MKKLFSLNEIENVAQDIIHLLGDRKLVVFDASMGAGKTTTISAVCKLLGVSPSSVSSPTFSIINEYAGENGRTIYHLDLYRIKNEQEAIAAGVEDVLFSGNVCLVEWPDVVANLLAENTMRVSLTVIEDDVRMIEIK